MAPRCYFDIRYARLETVKTSVQGIDRYVMIIGNGKVYENFHFEQEDVLVKWVHALASHCILGHLDKYFKSCQLTHTAKSLISEGSYGNIIIAEDVADTGCRVAVKSYLSDELARKLRPNRTKKNDPGDLTIDEVKALRKLAGAPRILNLRAVFEEPGYKILVTEYLEGGDLFTHMKRNNEVVNWREALELTREILLALTQLEAQKIVHRDIKFGNLALKYADGSYNLVLIDFGFAVFHEEYRRAGTYPKIYGTIGYYAPEILAMREMFDCRADVYSAGLVFFSMLSGESAFSYFNRDDCIRRNTLGMINWEALKERFTGQKIPPSVHHLLLSMLQFDKEKRPYASQLINHEAFQLLRIAQVVPHPRRNPNYKSIVSLEEDEAFFVTKENEEEVSQISKSSYKELEK